LAAAIADGKITKSQAQELLVASAEEKPRLIALIAERRKADRPVSLGELRSAVTDTRPPVALRNTSMPRIVAAEPQPFLPAAASAFGPSPEGTGESLRMARQQARMLRQTIEGQLPLLRASLHDAEVAADLNRILEALGSILCRPIG
jgi:hypothetical protein